MMCELCETLPATGSLGLCRDCFNMEVETAGCRCEARAVPLGGEIGVRHEIDCPLRRRGDRTRAQIDKSPIPLPHIPTTDIDRRLREIRNV